MNFLLTEKTEEDILRKRKAYLNRRVARVTGMFLEENRKRSIDLLVNQLSKLSQSELKFYIIGGELPSIPDDDNEIKSIKSASNLTGLTSEDIRSIARLLLEEREREIEHSSLEQHRDQANRNSMIAIGISILSLIVLSANVYLTQTDRSQAAKKIEATAQGGGT